MKKMRKALAVFLSLTIALTMGSAAFVYGATATTGKIKAPNNSRTYEVYQVFTGNVTTDTKVLTDAVWGENAAAAYTKDEPVPENVLKALEALNTETSNIVKYNEIKKYVNMTNPVNTISNGQVAELPAGYYVIKDIGPVEEGGTISYYVTTVVGGNEITITPKDSGISSKKKVKDDEVEGWIDSADYDIGEEFPFQLSAIVPNDISNYSVFPLTFHDKHDAGFEFNIASVKVYVDGKEISESSYTVYPDPEDGCDFGVHFDNLKAISGIKAGSLITVEYKAKLNGQANIGALGNVNTSHITYDTDPTDEDTDEDGKTPDDKVIVFTYEMDVNKYANSVAAGNELTGAEFSLTNKETGKEYTVEKDATGTKFVVKGLDNGTYILKETKVPEGFNKMPDKEITITATHELNSDNPKLDALSVNDVFTADKDKGIVTGNIVNAAGTTLPSTGDRGTLLFYLIGGILAAAAAVLLITRKRIQAR